jgi:hypothetical protein
MAGSEGATASIHESNVMSIFHSGSIFSWVRTPERFASCIYGKQKSVRAEGDAARAGKGQIRLCRMSSAICIAAIQTQRSTSL